MSLPSGRHLQDSGQACKPIRFKSLSRHTQEYWQAGKRTKDLQAPAQEEEVYPTALNQRIAAILNPADIENCSVCPFLKEAQIFSGGRIDSLRVKPTVKGHTNWSSVAPSGPGRSQKLVQIIPHPRVRKWSFHRCVRFRVLGYFHLNDWVVQCVFNVSSTKIQFIKMTIT